VADPDARWQLLPALGAPELEASRRNLIVSTWEATAGQLLVVVNFGPDPARCELPFARSAPGSSEPQLVDLLTDDRAVARATNGTPTLDLPAWGARVLQVR
jgi:hypothetical protein